jgi:hypothetical protein
MFCRRASIRSAITACSPAPAARQISRLPGNCSRHRHRLRLKNLLHRPIRDRHAHAAAVACSSPRSSNVPAKRAPRRLRGPHLGGWCRDPARRTSIHRRSCAACAIGRSYAQIDRQLNHRPDDGQISRAARRGIVPIALSTTIFFARCRRRAAHRRRRAARATVLDLSNPHRHRARCPRVRTWAVSVRRPEPRRATCDGRHPKTFTIPADRRMSVNRPRHPKAESPESHSSPSRCHQQIGQLSGKMRENDLLVPGRVGSPHGPCNHNGTIIAETINTARATYRAAYRLPAARRTILYCTASSASRAASALRNSSPACAAAGFPASNSDVA